ncbi:ribonuclease P protein component [Kiloniella sp. b19]|uniref:ribonuclease P protein component n=1 Tax=Kiloniella sp. GXU_MW_B19 TaxID=3141326 RepID=UPI0031D8776A
MLHIRTLKKRSEFLRIAATQQKWVTPGLILQARRRQTEGSLSSEGGLFGSSEDTLLGVGFTVTKKVGNAVERNRVKRRLRALASELLPERGKEGHDYVLIGRRLTLYRDYSDLKKDLAFALKRIRTDGSVPREPSRGPKKKNRQQ